MHEIRHCGKLGWAYCDGQCTTCQITMTTATTTVLNPTNFLTGMSHHPLTNSDNLRAMSDEELARWAWAVQSGISQENLLTTDEWLAWLQSPVDGGDHDA